MPFLSLALPILSVLFLRSSQQIPTDLFPCPSILHRACLRLTFASRCLASPSRFGACPCFAFATPLLAAPGRSNPSPRSSSQVYSLAYHFCADPLLSTSILNASVLFPRISYQIYAIAILTPSSLLHCLTTPFHAIA